MTAEEWGIPQLDPGMQARPCDLPSRWTKWGSVGRGSRGIEGYHFYTADYKFAGQRADPRKVIDSGARVAVEMNFSVLEGMAPALVMEGIWRKRSMSRAWQAGGVRVLVDLFVPDRVMDLALLGVPAGWGAYATRKAFGSTMADLDVNFDAAARHSRGNVEVFLVYGGGRKVRDHCLGRGWHWAQEHLREIHSKGRPA